MGEGYMVIPLFHILKMYNCINIKLRPKKNASQDFCSRFSVFAHLCVGVWLYFVFDVISFFFPI